jgi:hypothetical protein
MRAHAFRKVVTMDTVNLMEEVLRVLESEAVAYCAIGGQGVNAYADPLVSLDLDLVVATSAVDRTIAALPPHVRVERFAHSVNLSAPGSDLRIQFQLDPRYAEFPSRAATRTVLGAPLRVAAVEDVLAGKVWAASDVTRRASKRQKDLADIARLLEGFPQLRGRVPAEILARLV